MRRQLHIIIIIEASGKHAHSCCDICTTRSFVRLFNYPFHLRSVYFSFIFFLRVIVLWRLMSQIDDKWVGKIAKQNKRDNVRLHSHVFRLTFPFSKWRSTALNSLHLIVVCLQNMTSDTEEGCTLRRRTLSVTRAEEISTKEEKQRRSQPDKP